MSKRDREPSSLSTGEGILAKKTSSHELCSACESSPVGLVSSLCDHSVCKSQVVHNAIVALHQFDRTFNSADGPNSSEPLATMFYGPCAVGYDLQIEERWQQVFRIIAKYSGTSSVLDAGCSHHLLAGTWMAGCAPIVIAVACKMIDIVKALINAHASVTGIFGRASPTPLWCAATRNDVPMMRLLLANGASSDINRTCPAPNTSNPLYRAVLFGGVEMVRLLLNSRADPAIDSEVTVYSTRGYRVNGVPVYEEREHDIRQNPYQLATMLKYWFTFYNTRGNLSEITQIESLLKVYDTEWNPSSRGYRSFPSQSGRQGPGHTVYSTAFARPPPSLPAPSHPVCASNSFESGACAARIAAILATAAPSVASSGPPASSTSLDDVESVATVPDDDESTVDKQEAQVEEHNGGKHSLTF